MWIAVILERRQGLPNTAFCIVAVATRIYVCTCCVRVCRLRLCVPPPTHTSRHQTPIPTRKHTRHTHSCACNTCYKDSRKTAATPGRACVMPLSRLQAKRWVRAGAVSVRATGLYLPITLCSGTVY